MKHKPVSALLKGLAMLEAVSENPDGCTLNDLAAAAGCSAAAAHHLAHTLLEAGYLRRDVNSLRFFTGEMVYTLAGLNQQPQVLEMTARVLSRLHASLSEFTFFFCSSEEHNVVIRQQFPAGEGRQLQQGHDYVLPPFTSVGGIMHLSFAGEEFSRRYFTHHNFDAYGGVLWENMQTLQEQLDDVRDKGHFFLPSKSRLQIRAGLPLFNANGEFLGSLTCSADLPAGDSPAQARKRLLQAAKAIIAEETGYFGTESK